MSHRFVNVICGGFEQIEERLSHVARWSMWCKQTWDCWQKGVQGPNVPLGNGTVCQVNLPDAFKPAPAPAPAPAPPAAPPPLPACSGACSRSGARSCCCCPRKPSSCQLRIDRAAALHDLSCKLASIVMPRPIASMKTLFSTTVLYRSTQNRHLPSWNRLQLDVCYYEALMTRWAYMLYSVKRGAQVGTVPTPFSNAELKSCIRTILMWGEQTINVSQAVQMLTACPSGAIVSSLVNTR